MGVDLTTRTDLVLTWVGAAGVIAYTVYIHGQRSRSPLEARTLFLLYALGTLFLVRGFYWLYDGPWLETLRFVPTTLLPLAATLFVEGLRRRSEEHTSELQSRLHLVCRLLLEKKKKTYK